MKMSITRALSQIKRIDERLERLFANSTFIDVTIGKGVHQKLLVSGEVETLKRKIQSDMDSINAGFDERTKIKAAVVESNAKTKIELNGVMMSVAAAIEFKKSIELKRNLVLKMKNRLNHANVQVKNQNDKLEAQIELNLATIYGNEKGKVESTMYEAVAKPQRDQKEAALLDPIKLADAIEALEEEISAVDTELDFLLSESNAKTEIEV